MKPIFLLDHYGAVRRASADQIAEVLDGRVNTRLAHVTVSDSGDLEIVPLSESALAEQRATIDTRRCGELVKALDIVLAGRKAVEGLTGVNFYGQIFVDIEDAPYAEDAVRDWADQRGLFVKDDPMPTTGKTWRRTADVNMAGNAWAPTIVELRWPEQKLDGPSQVARDAEIDGKPAELVEQIRAEADSLEAF